MAYPHYLIEAKMEPTYVSTVAGATAPALLPYTQQVALGVGLYTTPTGFGAGAYAPLAAPVKVHRIGVRMNAAVANPFDLVFWKHIEGGATSWATSIGNPTGEYFRMMLPTVIDKVVYKDVTGTYIVRPGESLRCGATAAQSIQAMVGMLVSPVWEEPGNVTGMRQTTAP